MSECLRRRPGHIHSRAHRTKISPTSPGQAEIVVTFMRRETGSEDQRERPLRQEQPRGHEQGRRAPEHLAHVASDSWCATHRTANPAIADLLGIVTESVQAYKVCQSRVEAVEKALEEALKGSGAERQASERRHRLGGYLRDVVRTRAGGLAVGADVTGHLH